MILMVKTAGGRFSWTRFSTPRNTGWPFSPRAGPHLAPARTWPTFSPPPRRAAARRVRRSLGVCSGALVHVAGRGAGLSACGGLGLGFHRGQAAGAGYLVWLGSRPCARARRFIPRKTVRPATRGYRPGRSPPGRAHRRPEPQGGRVLHGLPAAVRRAGARRLASSSWCSASWSSSCRARGGRDSSGPPRAWPGCRPPRPRISLWLERALGITFIGLALRLAAERAS